MMKSALVYCLLLLSSAAIPSCNAFLVCRSQTKTLHAWPLSAAVELEAEPEGGEEITPFSSLPSCRVKCMKEQPKIKNDNGPVYEFWMQASAEGALVKEIRTQILKDASKKANFPGFRKVCGFETSTKSMPNFDTSTNLVVKGQVPPYAQPQITQFSVQESIIKTVENVIEAYGLKTVPGSDGEMKVREDVAAIARGYKIGDSIPFTATMNAIFDPEKKANQPTSAIDTAIDVEATVTE
jgi:hypothetical protein